MVEDENEDAIRNLDQVHDAFVFCPYLKPTEMDSMMAKGIFQKWNRNVGNLSDHTLERMVEDKNKDAIGNLEQVKDASIEMDRMMAQSIFQKWNRSVWSGWKKTLFPL